MNSGRTTSDSPFQSLVRRVRSGDEQAAEELVRMYEPHVRRAVRIRLNQPRLRQVVDSIDICQSVLARFFVHAATGQFRIESPKQLIALLVKMAENRIHDWHRYQSAQRRDKRREISLEVVPESRLPGVEDTQRVSTIDPSEMLDRLLNLLPKTVRRLAQSRLAGKSWPEIARQEGKSADALRMQLRRAVSRALQEIENEE